MDREIKKDLRKIAKDFNLKYSSAWFDYLLITKREGRYLEYVGMCWDPIYTPFGKTIEKRIENIEKFDKSSVLKKILKRYGGQMITSKEIKKGLKDCKKIKDQKLRKELLALHLLIQKKMKTTYLALLTKTNSNKEKEFLMRVVLKHEWIHELLFRNGVNFGKINYENFWKYDEGLTTFMDYYLCNRLGWLENMKKRTKYLSAKIDYTYATKFRKLLEDKRTPKGRKEVLVNLKRELMKK